MRLLSIFVVALNFGCIPKNLEKYRQNSLSSSANKRAATDAPDQVEQPLGPTSHANNVKRAPVRGAKPAVTTIYALDEQTFRFSLPEKDVWQTALNVLMRNYNLTIVDKDSGIITTEWDSFYLDEKVYRNRISLRVQRSGLNSVDVMVHNNVEKLQEGAAALGGVWLPSEDKAQEIKRVIQNMAILLNEPPPQFLKTMTAEGEELKPKNF